MKKTIQRYAAIISLSMLVFNLLPHKIFATNNNEIVYPLKQISKLECRFEEFDTLTSSCKQTLPILTTNEYEKYAKKDGGYNDYTRLYTVLWGSSYKYGWDVWNGGHQGTDIATAKGTPVYSIADGKVIEAWNDVAWGNYISIEHSIHGKKIVSNYAHLSKISVNKGQSVDVWEEIGNVGSTWNSTGNHLHFQIDLPSIFHPYYYDWNSCPYSYYNISETGVCFDILTEHTLDPLAFLESNGAILDNIHITKTISTSSSNSNTIKSAREIFDTTIYYGFGTSADIRKLQEVMTEMGYYDGQITGDYKDIEQAIIDFQLNTWVLSSKNEDGAGWFGPKTRSVALTQYNTFLNSSNTGANDVITTAKDTHVVQQNVTKVSRVNMLTREEIEAKEMENFLKSYKVDIMSEFTQIKKWETKTSIFSLTSNKDKWFRGNTPGKVTFSYDTSKISIFPESFFNFTDGTRELTITWLSTGHTTVDIKIWEVIVGKLSITIWNPWEKVQVESSKLYGAITIALGEEKTAVVLMKDKYGNKLLKTNYDWVFTLQSDDDILYCLKSGAVQDVKSVYKQDCRPDEYKKSVSFSYTDTVWWLVIFNYKVLDDTGTITIQAQNKEILSYNMNVTAVKNLSTSYPYYNEVISAVTSGVIDGIDRWYFSQDNDLTQQVAKEWIISAMRRWNYDQDSISRLEKTSVWRFDTMTRKDFLSLSYNYLGNNIKTNPPREYIDMQPDDESLVSSILWTQYKWKDDFWEKYFQPDKNITRWEAVYLLTIALENTWNGTIVRK